MLEIEQILYHFFKCEHKGYAEKIFLELKPSMIEEKNYRYIYRIINEFEKEFNRLPNYGEVKVRIDNDEVYIALEVLMENKEIGMLGQDVINSITENYIKKQSILDHIGYIYEYVEQYDFTKVSELVNRMQSRVLPFSFNENHWIKASDIDRVRAKITQNEELYPNGRLIQSFVQNGGTPRGTFTVYTGASHSGKSMFLINDTNNFTQLGQNVLFLSLEMKDTSILKETYSERTGFSPNSIDRLMEDLSYKEVLGKFFDAQDDKIGEVFVEELPEGSLSVGAVRNLINEIELKEQTKIDVLVIDYINLMKTDKKLQRDERVKELIEPLRGLCKELNLIGISATQMTRKFDEMITLNPDKVFDANKSHIQEGDALFRACDYVYIILNSELIKQQNRVYLKPIKLRGTDGQYINKRISLTFDGYTSKLLETQDKCNQDIIGNDKLYQEILAKYQENYDTYGLRCLEGQNLSKYIELTNRQFKNNRFNVEMRKNVNNIVTDSKKEPEVVEEKIEEVQIAEPIKIEKKSIYDDGVEQISDVMNMYNEI